MPQQPKATSLIPRFNLLDGLNVFNDFDVCDWTIDRAEEA